MKEKKTFLLQPLRVYTLMYIISVAPCRLLFNLHVHISELTYRPITQGVCTNL